MNRSPFPADKGYKNRKNAFPGGPSRIAETLLKGVMA